MLAVEPEIFAHLALDPVPDHSASYLAAGCYPEPGVIVLIMLPDNQEGRSGYTGPASREPGELWPQQQADRLRVRGTLQWHGYQRTQVLLGCDLDRQTLAALGTTTLDYQATVFGGHTHQKAMGTLTRGIAGLESSFHDTAPSIRRACCSYAAVTTPVW